MKESAAWREIANRIENGLWAQTGLCHEIDRLFWEDVIDLRTCNAMGQRVNEHEVAAGTYDGGDHWPYAFRKGSAPERVIAANLLALEAADEEKYLGSFGR